MYIKKIRALILCLAITAGMFIFLQTVQAENVKWDGTTVDYSWYDGKSSPYTISTPAQFAAFGNILNKEGGYNDRFAGKTIQLAADLDMGGKPFRAMGGHEDDMAFAGTFEGQGHIISNLNITEKGLSAEYVALFSRLSGGAIRNLGLEGVTVDVTDAKNQAAFVGKLMDASTPATVENCFVRDVDMKLTLQTTNNTNKVGGFVASVNNYPLNTSPNTIRNCYAVNVRISRKDGTGDVGHGIGHFTGYSDGGAYSNCYSGGVTEKPSDSKLPNTVLSFGMFNAASDTNCYSDCYADDDGLFYFWNNGFRRGGSKVSAAKLKEMTGGVVLGAEFVKAENDLYNYGYPFLKWEEKYLDNIRQPQPEGPLTVESHREAGNQQYNVTVSALSGAVEYRYLAYGNSSAWQNSNIFKNLPSGKYTFEARTKGTTDKYPSKPITTDEITLGDLSVWNGVSADYSWYDGKEAPYTISTPAQFAAFGNILNKVGGRDDRFAGKTIRLAADLDMGGKPFRAMGGTKEGQEFMGTFEGGGHIISNLNITECGLDGECAALFVCIKNGGAVRNLGIENVKINNVKGAINQAAFAGLLIGDYNQPVTIENCFVRDVEFIISKDITNGRIGGFVAVVSDWPKEPSGTYNSITNCYAVNVEFKGIGSNTWTIGYFAGPSDGGKFTNCYSGGTLNAEGFSVEKFGRLGDLAQESNCYSDGADSGKIRFPFRGGGTQVSADTLKGRTEDAVNLGDAFLTIDHDFYNYGYPYLKWEKENGNVKEDNGPLPTEPLEVESSEQAGDQLYDVTLNAIADAEYRYVTCGKTSDWQDDNIFANLPSGKYTFEARMKENEMYYPSGVITTGEETTLGDPSVWNGVSVDYSWYDGKESPYTISTAAQFAAFGNILNKLDGRDDTFTGKTIQLAHDLDMNCKPFRAMGGTETEDAFAGTFEGGGHIISNLKITEAGLDEECAALFVSINNGGTVRNLGIEGITIEIHGVVKYQAAFAGVIMGDSACTIENCFVRDVNINLTLPIRNGKVGGFVASVSGDAQNEIKNCYAVNVCLFRKSGKGDVKYGFGHFAGVSEGGAFTNCYSGGVTEKPSDSVLPNKTMSFGILKMTVADNNCYSDCYVDDSSFEDSFANGYRRGGKQVLTSDLKGMTGGVNMGEGFKRIPGIHYNYGYPVLDWEIPTVYLAETGSDDNNGTSEKPVKTLEKALTLVPRIGIIEVEGTVDVSESITLENRIVFFRGSGKLNKIGSNSIAGNGIVDFGSFTGDVTSLNVFEGLEEVYGPWTIKTTGNYTVYWVGGYNENRLEKVWCAVGNTSAPVDVTGADTSREVLVTTVYVWDDDMQPIVKKYTLGEKLQ